MNGRWFPSSRRSGNSKWRAARWLAAALLGAIIIGATFASAANINVPPSRAGVVKVTMPPHPRAVGPSREGQADIEPTAPTGGAGVAAPTSPTAAEMGEPTGPAKTPEVIAEPASVGQSPSEPAPVTSGS